MTDTFLNDLRKKYTETLEIKAILEKYIIGRVSLYAWMAGRLEDIVDSIPEKYSAVSTVFNIEFFVAQIKKLDDEYAEKEAALFNLYQPLIRKYSKPHKIEADEDLKISIAEVKNKINIAVAAVSTSASNLLHTPQAAEIEGAPRARLDYLSSLTLRKQISEFEDIIEKMRLQ